VCVRQGTESHDCSSFGCGMKDDEQESTGSGPPSYASPSASSPPPKEVSRRSRQLAVLASRVRARVLFMVLDTVCVAAGYGASEVIYYRRVAPSNYWPHFTGVVAIIIVLTLLSNHLFGLYGRMWRHAGVDEARQMIFSAGAMGIVILVLYPIGHAVGFEQAPVIVMLVGLVFATIGMSVLRFHTRIFAWQRGSRGTGLRVAIVGSRDTAASAIREMLRCPGAGLVPVAVFDDDTSVHGMSLMGVPVVGFINDITASTSRYNLQQVLLAIPGPSPEMITKVLYASEAAGITMKVLPTVHDLVKGSPDILAIQRAREPRIEDLLGRTPVSTDLAGVRKSLQGHRVLVTGAGGSIGSEICRQVARFDPTVVILLDHDETHIHDAAASISGPIEQALVDITDRDAVFEAFARYRPDVVLHAAAHKHVPVLEKHPVSAAKTNVLGSLNVIEASAATNVRRFVLISTDKAVRPSSVMGASKRVAEQVLLARAPADASYCAVRFGNVLGSRGSVIPTFTRQIEAGGPVTVTDPRMTRFFMSVEEAVQLVLQASLLSAGGEIFMLEMGEPVRIVDLALRMIRLSGARVDVDIDIEYVGVRPGEKLQETLHEPEERVLPTEHASIAKLVPLTASQAEFDAGIELLAEATRRRDPELVRYLLFAAAQSTGDQEVRASQVEPAGQDAVQLSRPLEPATFGHDSPGTE
jgi:FlaA1/EpsC-like NDP-sugar epimerase